eukprot:365644-Chlamydomonas_euryale.AAC.3
MAAALQGAAPPRASDWLDRGTSGWVRQGHAGTESVQIGVDPRAPCICWHGRYGCLGWQVWMPGMAGMGARNGMYGCLGWQVWMPGMAGMDAGPCQPEQTIPANRARFTSSMLAHAALAQ